MASRLCNTPTTRYITTMQLVQFATSFVLTVVFRWYSYDGRECIGSHFGPFEFTLAANVSFFVRIAPRRSALRITSRFHRLYDRCNWPGWSSLTPARRRLPSLWAALAGPLLAVLRFELQRAEGQPGRQGRQEKFVV